MTELRTFHLVALVNRQQRPVYAILSEGKSVHSYFEQRHSKARRKTRPHTERQDAIIIQLMRAAHTLTSFHEGNHSVAISYVWKVMEELCGEDLSWERHSYFFLTLRLLFEVSTTVGLFKHAMGILQHVRCPRGAADADDITWAWRDMPTRLVPVSRTHAAITLYDRKSSVRLHLS